MMKTLFKLGVISLPIIIVVLCAVRIVVANTLASSSETLQSIDKKIVAISEENDRMGQDIASSSSLIAIEARARELGFSEPTKDQILTISAGQFPFALK